MIGFYPIQASEIRFGRDGRWYADGEPITNLRIAALFARHLVRLDDGTYAVRMAGEQAPVEVDDTPFVITAVDVDVVDGVLLHVNDGSSERLDPDSLSTGSGEVLYCRIKAGSERARFLRPAYYQLAAHVREDGTGRFALVLGDRTYPLPRAGEEPEAVRVR